MEKTNFILVIVLTYLQVASLQAQELVSTAGNYFENEQVSISWSLGETVIDTYASGELTLTQGFQQPAIHLGTFYENPDSDFQLTAFPNPTKAFVTVQTNHNQTENLEYRLFDIRGSLILSDRLAGDNTRINLDDYHPGIYFLSIQNDELLLKVFKIIRQ